MKKTFLKITLSVLCIVGLASCLGDSDSYMSGSGFAYVKSDDKTGEPFMWVLSGYAYPIKSSVLNNSDLEPGDCAYVSFKIYPEKVSGSYYVTDDLVIPEENRFYRKDHLRLKSEVAPKVSSTDTINVFTGISLYPGGATNESLLGDKWLISHSMLLQKDQGKTITLYYDKSNQPDLEKNIVYIDARVIKSEPVEGGKFVSTTKAVVADLSSLRYDLLMSAAKDKSYNVFFRYYIKEKKDGVYVAAEKSTLLGEIRKDRETGSDQY